MRITIEDDQTVPRATRSDLTTGRAAPVECPAVAARHRRRTPTDDAGTRRWRDFQREVRALFGPLPDGKTLALLRRRFDAGQLTPEMIRASARARDFGWPSPRDGGCGGESLRQMAEDPRAFLAWVLDGALEEAARLARAPVAAARLPASDLLTFDGAAQWARRQPDPVAALAADIEDEPRFSGIAAWPRLAYLLAHFSPGELEPHGDEIDRLQKLATAELSHRPAGVPAKIYRMLGIADPDPRAARDLRQMAAEGRRRLAANTGAIADLMLLSGPRPDDAPGGAQEP